MRPGLVPRHAVFVVEQALQLDDRDGGMGVVELDRDLLREVFPVLVGPAEAADDVLERTGDKEVLLEQAQFLAALGLVVRVENLRDGFAVVLFAHGFLVTAAVEGLEIELLRRSRFPEAQEVHRVGAVAGHRNVVGNADQFLPAHPARDVVAAVVEDVLDVAIDLDLGGVLGPDDLPRRSVLHPCVGKLDLVAIAKFLLEEPVLVMDSVADGRKIQRRQRVEEAGGETAEAAVAQPHVVFLMAKLLVVQTQFLERVHHVVVDARAVEAVGKEPPHQKLERKIVDPLDVLVVMHGRRGDHSFDDHALHRLGGRQPPIALRGRRGVASQTEFQAALDQGF